MLLSSLAWRFLIATVFATAGVAKLAGTAETRAALAAVRLPRRVAATAAILLAPSELLLSGTLLVPTTARWSAAVAAAVLTAFATVLSVQVRRGAATDCRCFGRLHRGPVTWRSVYRNLILAGLAVLVVIGGSPQLTPFFWRDDGGLFAVALGIALAAALLTPPGLSARTSRPLRHFRGRRIAPAFILPRLDGGTESLDSLVARGFPVLLVFADPGCGPCVDLMPSVAAWQRQARGLTVAVLSRVPRDAVMVATANVNDVLRDEGNVAAAYDVVATPSAVLVDRTRALVGEPACGAAQIGRVVSNLLIPSGPSEQLVSDPSPGISRRRAIQSAAGSFGLTLLAPESRALARAPQHQKATIASPSNTRHDKCCADFLRYMNEHGVVDADNHEHPGWAGATLLRITPAYSYKFKPPQRAHHRVCVTAEAEITYTGDISVEPLRWAPSRDVRAGCQTAIKRFDQAVDRHEEHHRQDAQRILDRAQTQTDHEVVTECGGSASEAKTRALHGIAAAAEDHQKNFLDEYSKSIKKFHASAKGGPARIDCDSCDECVGSSENCHECQRLCERQRCPPGEVCARCGGGHLCCQEPG